MKKQFSLLVILFVCQFTFSQIVINELDCDTPSTDDKEFVELKSDTPNFALDGYVLVFFNGSSSGGDASYFTVALDGYQTDINGLFVIGSDTVVPFPQLLISANTIQNGADAVAIYSGSESDFPEGTVATQTNLIDALVYDTSDSDDAVLMALLGVTEQINEGSSNNTNSIQRLQDGSYVSTTPTPRADNDGISESYIAITMATDQEQYNEGESFDIVFSTDENVTEDITFSFTLDNYGFNTSDFSGNTTVTIPNGANTVSTTITIINDTFDEGDEELIIKYVNLDWPYIANNNFLKLRVNDDDFTVAPFGTPLNPTYDVVASTQPAGYYDSLDGLADTSLRQALQDIIADPNIVRAQTYADIIDILKEADQNPANSNQVWLVYTEQGRAKLDYQLTSDSNGKWNREHTYPRSRGGFYNIEEDEIADGVDVFWTTKADSLRHGNSDAHALRAVDGPENSSRNNNNYGDPNLGGYNGPENTDGSFYGDVARSVLYMAVRYNGLSLVNGYPVDEDANDGTLGDLATLLEWHRNDPPDDFEMNRNNVVYTWQFNRNPFIDQPDLVEYIWGNQIGATWDQELSIAENNELKVQVYPNPATNKVSINGLLNQAEVEVFSVEGRKIKTYNVNGNSVLHINLSSGMYVFKITSEGKSTFKKIVIQ
ncbi:endonuclease [Lacinutrix sp. C3R15]|uniref:endonuclease n=1 Tax=Flavobacteriaceae TaxID=49546 RepID=UPI001C0A3BD0|nr:MULTISPECIES: endonuclease [Flavobacteriaceae]MBU2940280.1 endonuclease [Lacinutrix sp. C3R15]MDO6623599.1 endonuclease [Oceanihabitans sp. 1_MG-2023]